MEDDHQDFQNGTTAKSNNNLIQFNSIQYNLKVVACDHFYYKFNQISI